MQQECAEGQKEGRLCKSGIMLDQNLGSAFGHMALCQLVGQPECVLVCVIVADCGLCAYFSECVLGEVYAFEFIYVYACV